jgi:hypothetical protein
MEYALGLAPTEPNRGALQIARNGAALHLTYSRPAAVTDVAYEVDWTAAVGLPWSSAGVTQQVIADDGVTRTLRASLPAGAGQRFMRLKVSQR